MAVTQWNDAEDMALLGLPLAARVLYLQGLRRFMDYRTGEVGRSRRISWQMLREVLYVEPHQGLVDTGTPTRATVRRLMEWLVKAGLVVARGDGEWLIFLLPLASRDESAPNKPDPNPTLSRPRHPDPKPGHAEASSDAACSDNPGQHPDPLYPQGVEHKPGLPPESGYISHTAAHSSVSDIARARDLKMARKTVHALLVEASVQVVSEDDPLVVLWVEQGLTPERLTECLVKARRKKLNQPIPLNFLRCFVDEAMGRQEAPVWSVLPRRDEELESWARVHGYSRPSVSLRNYAEYRAMLRSEVERRLDGGVSDGA